MYMYDISPYGYPSAALQCYLIQASLVNGMFTII